MSQRTKSVVLAGMLGIMFAGPVTADELRFTEIQMPLGSTASQVTPAANAYAAFGITVSDVYRYHDDRDPFSDGAENQGSNPYGLSVLAEIGGITFDNPVSNLEVDWWTIDENTFYLDVYDTNNVLVHSFNGTGSGTEVINLSGIGSLTWHDTGGYVQISNLRYDQVPEPGTVALLGLGLAGLAASRRRKQ